jgi:tyrosine-protein kinase Etk/Wzc
VHSEINSNPTEPARRGTEPPSAIPPGDEAFGLIDLLLQLGERKRLIGSASLACGVLAAIVAFLLPDTYTAVALLLPPQQPETNASAMLGQLGPLASVAGRDLGLKTPGELYVGLLGSRTIADHVIESFGLKSVFKAKTMVDARNKLRSVAKFSTGKDSLVRVEVEDRDPRRAAAMANLFVAELNRQNSAFGTNEAAHRRAFLEKRVRDEKEALAEAEDAMKSTQSRTGIIQVEAQNSLAIASVAQLKAQIAAGEVARDGLKTGATAQNPEVIRAEAELTALRSQLKDLEEKSHGGSDPLMATAALPRSNLEYLRSLRDLKFHEFLFEMLSKQCEAARMDESKAAPTIQVVDAAVPPDKKSGPHRGLITVFGVVAGLLLGSAAAYVRHGGGDPELRRKVHALGGLFSVRGAQAAHGASGAQGA